MASAPPSIAIPPASGFVAPVAAFRVTLDGQDLTNKIAPRLLSLRITEKRAGEADEISLVLHDKDNSLAIPRRGVLIRAALGWERGSGLQLGLVDKGSFTVDEVSWSGPPDVVTVSGRSADLTAGYRKRRDASYRETTLGTVVRQVAARHGLTPQIAPELADIEVPVLGQTAKSDMAMIRGLGRRHDAVATVKSGKLILSPISAGTTAGGRVIPGATIARADCQTWNYQLASREDYDGVEADWHDQDAAQRETVKVGGTRNPKRLRRTYATELDATHAARAEHSRIQRADAKLDLDLALGRPDLYPNRGIAVSGFKSEIDARRWLIAEAEHEMDGQGGLRTRLELEVPN
jgi:uncharacterized protein